ncbi:MAG: hypothetical protein QNJ81_02125 [Acidimicrobiia bacterium]|nr:hypothetical protein [Acidimicrobiia bacterium]
MKDTKVTKEEMADFVVTMINRDLDHGHLSFADKLDYLTTIGVFVNTQVDRLKSAKDTADAMISAGVIGEDRPEVEESDIDLDIPGLLRKAFPGAAVIDMTQRDDIDTFRQDLSMLDSLFEAIRPPDVKTMNPIQFIDSGTCLKNADAHAWLYEHKIPHSYDHIHVFDDDMCLVLPDDDFPHGNSDVYWIEPDGVRSEGDVLKVLKEMFHAYTERHKEGEV